MLVVPVAYTAFNDFKAGRESGYVRHLENGTDVPSEMDELAEFAGRVCYQSWDRPRPDTATNQGYLKNILNQGHFSILEHASVSFYVEGVSRSLLTELERHRFLSFSVISQRFVDGSNVRFVPPPAVLDVMRVNFPDMSESELWDEFQRQPIFEDVRRAYTAVEEGLKENHPDYLSRKEIREAARSILPNCTEVKMVVTGNIRAWRDVIGKRYHEAADAEIREFATKVLGHLRKFAPNSLQDIPEQPYS